MCVYVIMLHHPFTHFIKTCGNHFSVFKWHNSTLKFHLGEVWKAFCLIESSLSVSLCLSLVFPSPSFRRHLLFSHNFQQVCTRIRPSLKDITWSRCIFNYHLMQSPSSVNALDLGPLPYTYVCSCCLDTCASNSFLSYTHITPLLSLSLSLSLSLPFSSLFPFDCFDHLLFSSLNP